MDLEVLRIAANTDNNRNIENRTHVSKLKNLVCGDEMQIELILKNEKILDFGYQGKSCVYCQASASLLSKISINNQKEKINDLCDKAELYFNDDVRISSPVSFMIAIRTPLVPRSIPRNKLFSFIYILGCTY